MMVIHIVIANIFVAIKSGCYKKRNFLNILLIFAFVCFSFANEYRKCLRLCNQHCVNECEEIKQSQKEKNIKEEWIQHEYKECLKFCDQHCVNKCKENYGYSSDYEKKRHNTKNV
jgi:hypothetical protein